MWKKANDVRRTDGEPVLFQPGMDPAAATSLVFFLLV